MASLFQRVKNLFNSKPKATNKSSDVMIIGQFSSNPMYSGNTQQSQNALYASPQSKTASVAYQGMPPIAPSEPKVERAQTEWKRVDASAVGQQQRLSGQQRVSKKYEAVPANTQLPIKTAASVGYQGMPPVDASPPQAAPVQNKDPGYAIALQDKAATNPIRRSVNSGYAAMLGTTKGRITAAPPVAQQNPGYSPLLQGQTATAAHNNAAVTLRRSTNGPGYASMLAKAEHPANKQRAVTKNDAFRGAVANIQTDKQKNATAPTLPTATPK